MIDGKRVLAICPARGGSKGIPRKNLQPFLGVPLVAHVGRLVGSLSVVDRAVVSTDDPKIADVARQSGLDAPFFRPERLAGDRVSDADVLRHGLAETERIDGVAYDVVVMLQPTSPLRRPEHVIRAVEMLVRENWEAVWSVSPTDSKCHPLKQLTLQEDGCLGYYDPAGSRIIARQQLSPLYHRNGVVYAIRRQCLLEKGILGSRTGALVLDEPLISIDTRWDLELAEWIHARRKSQP